MAIVPFEATVYRILIASPGDVGPDREVITNVINEWNYFNANSQKKVILPVRWETHSAPLYGERPQGIINEQLVEQCDLLVGLFWTKIGTHTGIALSGTVEEIEYFRSTGKPAMIYFSDKPIVPGQINTDQFTQLNEYREKLTKNGFVGKYVDAQDLNM